MQKKQISKKNVAGAASVVPSMLKGKKQKVVAGGDLSAMRQGKLKIIDALYKDLLWFFSTVLNIPRYSSKPAYEGESEVLFDDGEFGKINTLESLKKIVACPVYSVPYTDDLFLVVDELHCDFLAIENYYKEMPPVEHEEKFDYALLVIAVWLKDMIKQYNDDTVRYLQTHYKIKKSKKDKSDDKLNTVRSWFDKKQKGDPQFINLISTERKGREIARQFYDELSSDPKDLFAVKAYKGADEEKKADIIRVFRRDYISVVQKEFLGKLKNKNKR